MVVMARTSEESTKKSFGSFSSFFIMDNSVQPSIAQSHPSDYNTPIILLNWSMSAFLPALT